MPFRKDDPNIIFKVNEIINIHKEAFLEHYIDRLITRYYFISSTDELNEILSISKKIDYVTIYKKKQLSYRVIVDFDFEKKILSEYSTLHSKYYVIFNYVQYPEELEIYGEGSNLEELKEDIKEIITDYRDERLKICFGIDPRPSYFNTKLDENENFIIISDM